MAATAGFLEVFVEANNPDCEAGAKPPVLPRVCAAVVTFQPDEGIADRLAMIARQSDALVIIDNASEPCHGQRLREAAADLGGTVLWNDKNRGIGTALNQAAEWAIQQNYSYLATFDQDSVLDPNMISTLLTLIQSSRAPDLVGMIGPNFRREGSQRPWVHDAFFANAPVQSCTTIISSGAILSLEAYKIAGPFRDDFFIDEVDEEYCLRLRRHGYQILITRQPLMTHAVGRQVQIRILGQTIACSHHSPLRRYYMTRNRLATIREYAFREPIWALGRMRRIAQDAFVVTMWEQERIAKLRAMAVGAWDSLLGKLGPATRTW